MNFKMLVFYYCQIINSVIFFIVFVEKYTGFFQCASPTNDPYYILLPHDNDGPTTHKPITNEKKDEVSCQKTFEFGAENKTVRDFVTPKCPKIKPTLKPLVLL